MSKMFLGVSNTISLDLSGIITSNVLSIESMFQEYKGEYIYLNNFDTSSVTNWNKMFYKSPSLISIDLSNFNTSNSETMESMFEECVKLLIINLTNILTPKLQSIQHMFSGCKSLRNLNFGNFDARHIKNMNNLFSGCENLEILDLSEVSSSSVENMEKMFYGCTSLKCLNLPKFNTENVKNFYQMFYGCNNLEEIKIGEFSTKSSFGNALEKMFYNCSKLKEIDLSKFETSLITSLNSIFYNCENLVHLNLEKFNTSLITDMNQMFYGCKNLKSLDLSNFNTSNVISMDEMFSDCTNIHHINFQNINTKSLFSMSKIFKNCKTLEFINLYSLEVYKNIIVDEMLYGIPESISYCINEGLKALLIKEEFDKKENATNNCIDFCIRENKYIIQDKNKCIDNCMLDDRYKYFYDNLCVQFCPEFYPYKMIATYQCIPNCFSKDFFNNECKLNNKSSVNIENLINDIEKDLTSRLLDSLIDSSINEKNEDLIIKDDDIIYQITSTENQNNNGYSNISTIDLKECEIKLKQYYGISETESLIILKIDYNVPDILIPIVEYKIFHPETKAPLDLNICKDTSITLSYPISIEDNELYKYDPTSAYYTDKCYPFTTENKTDITLNDRKREYNNKYYGICENNCEFMEFENKNGTKKSKCECQVKTTFKTILSIDIDKDKLLNNFVDFRSTSNIDVILCPKTLFCKDGIIKNIGFYILLGNIISHIICGMIFYLKEYNKIIKLVYSIIKLKKEENNENKNNKDEKNNNKEKEIITHNNNDELSLNYIQKDLQIINNSKDKIYNLKIENENNKNPPKKTSLILKDGKQNFLNFNFNKKNSFINSKNTADINLKKSNDFLLDNSKNHILKTSNSISDINLLNYTDNEMNSLSYNEALLIDKRTYFQYYISLIKAKHLLIFTFYTKNDYNSRLIKISFFYFSFSLLLSVNSLFFQDSTMHKIYEENGIFNVVYQLPKILYSTIISSILSIIAKNLSLTEKNIIKVKNDKNINDSFEKLTNITKTIFLKTFLYFILMTVFLLSFWYYLSCFCSVYKNTQISLLKNCLISFGISQVYPFGINLIPGLFRIPSLKSKKKDQNKLYFISTIIQLI